MTSRATTTAADAMPTSRRTRCLAGRRTTLRGALRAFGEGEVHPVRVGVDRDAGERQMAEGRPACQLPLREGEFGFDPGTEGFRQVGRQLVDGVVQVCPAPAGPGGRPPEMERGPDLFLVRLHGVGDDGLDERGEEPCATARLVLQAFRTLARAAGTASLPVADRAGHRLGADALGTGHVALAAAPAPVGPGFPPTLRVRGRLPAAPVTRAAARPARVGPTAAAVARHRLRTDLRTAPATGLAVAFPGGAVRTRHLRDRAREHQFHRR